MVNHINIKMIIFTSVLILSYSIVLNARGQHWQDVSRWNSLGLPSDFGEAIEQSQNLNEFECSYGQCDEEKEKSNRLRMIETNELQFKRRPTYDVDSPTSIIPYFHTSKPQPCSCSSRNNLLDLGPTCWPRYLSSAICNASTCGGGGLYHCRQLSYNVRVLTKRGPNDLTDAQLPEVLRKDWMFKTFKINVSCVCKLSEK